MAGLRQLIEGLQRLSVVTGTPAGAALRAWSAPLPTKVNTLTQLWVQTPSNRSSLHTSSSLQRNLDSRRVPIFKGASKQTNRWKPLQRMRDMYEYTTEPLPFPRTGGRGPNGRIWNHKRGGGWKRHFLMVDFSRGTESTGPPLVEKVEQIIEDRLCRSGNLALVASGEHKRYVVATANMKPGDLIKTSGQLTRTPVRPEEGDAYLLGSLPVGAMVSCVELYPGEGALIARAAGSSAQIVRKIDDKVVVRMPSKREVLVSDKCMATVGRVSNVDHNKRVIGKAGVNRWMGIRPRSGRWHRKEGRQGRKLNPIKPMKVLDKPPGPKAAFKNITGIRV